MILVAKMNGDISVNTDSIINDIGNGNSKTGKRIYLEIKKRIDTLTSEQISLLVNESIDIQKQIAFLAICKTYSFIRDFVIEVIRDKVLLFDYELSEGEYITFLRNKQDIHFEIDKLSELSLNKVKQVTFKILEQASIIDSIKYRNIQAQLLEEKVIEAITNDNKKWLEVFFVSDMDIINY